MTNEELDNARAEEAWNIYNREHSGDVSAIAARLAREGWTPPVAVDPDLVEAREIVAQLYDVSWPERADYIRMGRQDNNVENVSALAGIKRGRALAAAEAKPGVVWVKHDGAAYRPAFPGAWVTTRNKIGGYISYSTKIANDCDWSVVTHYAVIPPPAEDVA